MEKNRNENWVQLDFVHWCYSIEGVENGITFEVFKQWLMVLYPPHKTKSIVDGTLITNGADDV